MYKASLSLNYTSHVVVPDPAYYLAYLFVSEIFVYGLDVSQRIISPQRKSVWANKSMETASYTKANCACSVTAPICHSVDHEFHASQIIPPFDHAARDLQFKYLGSQFYGNDGGGF
ncbi:hypothetical protein T440DRAFT_230029 [Plenodomus tracheiphilus IPT5]|uniref:Uncharacterized protein n=1 Tax=Plenodomus tracheiphilus IPT5 TaxID=1408161 RepID=A0A6A7AWB7_9PLEO|nr:hypothetical protein T440DRAFT_230029 [Plenodomus tracheiphilus IPT5]